MTRNTDGIKLRGRRLYALLRELAEDELTQNQLAQKYGVTQARVSQLKKQYAEEIAEMAEDLEDVYAGLWIAKKEERIKSYIRLAEMIERDLEENGMDAQIANRLIAVNKAVAEEMGQLPSRVVVRHEGPKADYTIGGVDPRELT